MKMLDFLRERGIHFVAPHEAGSTKHNTSGWVNTYCPACCTDKLWLGYSLKGDYFSCWSCGYKSKIQLFRLWFPQENPQALLSQIEELVAVKEQYIPTGIYKPPTNRIPLLQSIPHLNYLENRNINPRELHEQWGVEAICESSEYVYRHKLFFPVLNVNKVPVSWLVRSIYDSDKIKYLAAPQDRERLPLKWHLYGEQYVDPFSTVIIVEGVFDKLRIGKNALATFGKKLTKEQFDKIAHYQRRIICFDNEKDTQKQAKDLAKALSAYSGLTDNVCLTSAKDPAEADQAEIEELLKFAELTL